MMKKIMKSLVFFVCTCLVVASLVQPSLAQGISEGEAIDAAPTSASFVRTLYIGPRIGVNITTLENNGSIFGASPEFMARFDLHLLKYLGLKMDFGFSESHLPVEGGTVKVDFLKLNVLVDARFQMLDKSKKHKFVDDIFLYVMGGPYLNILLSSILKDSREGSTKEFGDYYHPAVVGLMLGCGFEISISSMRWFFEISGSRSLSPGLKDYDSATVTVRQSAEWGIQVGLGITFFIVNF